MRVCVGPDMSWLNFVGRRPFPLEDGEDTISRLCPIGERLTNLLQRGGFPATTSVEGFSPVTLSDEVFLGETLDAMERLVHPSFFKVGQAFTARS